MHKLFGVPEITPSFFNGVVCSEGNFYISFQVQKNTNYLVVDFGFSINQTDMDILESSVRLFEGMTDSRLPSISGPVKGCSAWAIRNNKLLLDVFEPYFQKYPLMSAKYRDCCIFFFGLHKYLDTSIARHRRILYLVHLFEHMNLAGPRKYTLVEYERFLKPSFKNEEEFAACRAKVRNEIALMLQNSYSSFNNVHIRWDEYLLGLVLGDGCFHVGFELRHNRKANVGKELSISLPNKQRNIEMMEHIAQYLSAQVQHPISWIMKRGSRIQFVIKRKDIITPYIHEFFMEREEILTFKKRAELWGWDKIDRVREIISRKTFTAEEVAILDQFLTDLYFIHSGGVWRKKEPIEIAQKFERDYSISLPKFKNSVRLR